MLGVLTRPWRARLGLRRKGWKQVPGVPDLNLIPEEYRPRPLLSPERSMLLLFLVEMAVAVLLFQRFGENTMATVRRFTGGEPGQGQQDKRAELLTSQINRLKARVNQLNTAQEEFDKRKFNWAQFLGSIFTEGGASVEVLTLTETLEGVVIAGSGTNSEAAVAFRERLLKLPNITQVRVLTLGEVASGRGSAFSFRVDLNKGGLR